MALIIYFATRLWDFSPKRKPKIKKHHYFATKKTKRLSLQQNEGRPSRSQATQRFPVRPRAFFGAVSPSGWHHARRAKQGASTARHDAHSR